MIVMALVLVGVAAAQPGAKTELYVAPNGNDANPGTREKPVATLSAARDAVRRIKQQGLKQPVDVIVQAGTYYLSDPLTFGPEDSGTATCPITYRAATGAKAVLSGGTPITGWRQQEDKLWVADVPQGVDFKTLRVGEQWAIRARHPNYDPQNPYTGGWLFAVWGGEPWEKGQFNVGVANVHNVNDRLTWKIRVPAAGTYRVWLRYGHKMTDYGRPEMGGSYAFKVNGGEPVLLQNLPDTGAWNTFRWTHTCDLKLEAGEQVLEWVNLKGGGINMDAMALTEDENWNPDQAIGAIQWWGGFDLKQPAEGKHLLLIQTEACDTHEGPEIQVPQPSPPGTTKHLCFAPGAVPQFADVKGAEVHIFIAWGWVNAIVPIERIEYPDNKIVFAGGGAAQDVRIGNRFFIENVREALDAPGEWFLDKEKSQVLYIPDNPAFPNVPTVAGTQEKLIVFQGDAKAGQFVEHVNLQGFEFRDSGYTITAEYYHPRDGTIWMNMTRNCSVSDCEFAWLGGYALRLAEKSEQCDFVRNHVHHVGQGGVILWGSTADGPHHCRVLGNTMDHLGLIYKHVAGVYVTHGSDNLVAHNRITDVPRYAISFKSQGEDNLSHRNIAEYNEMIRTNLETNDTGAFESLGYEHRDSGNIVRYNLILDSVGLATTPDGKILTPYFTWGVYLDDYSSGTTVYGNIVARTVVGGVCIHGGQNNIIENNIMVDAQDQQVRLQPRDDFMKGNTFIHNIVAYARPEATLVFCWTNRKGMFTEWDNNLYWLKGADLKTLATKNTPEGTFAQWVAAGYDAHSQVADPLFVDAAHDDYRLKPNSPALALGFKPIPVEKIGPKGLGK
jgi:parallel beta-helix repeat protein